MNSSRHFNPITIFIHWLYSIITRNGIYDKEYIDERVTILLSARMLRINICQCVWLNGKAQHCRRPRHGSEIFHEQYISWWLCLRILPDKVRIF
jgi:hypothetical protein